MIKKTMFTLIAAFLVIASYAQESKIIVKGGVNIANVSITDNGSYDDANALVSFHAGIMADLPVSKFFSFQPGLLFTGKGTKSQKGQPSDASYFKATSNPYYVELPVNLVAKIPLASNGSSFFIGAGPYLAAGVGGKNKTEGKVFGVSFNRERNIKFSDDNPLTGNEEGAGFGIIKRFDYGLNGTAGFELNNLLLSVNYGYGLAKLNSGSNNNEDNDNKHRVLSFSVGIKL